MIEFDLPKAQSSIIKVLGVGGGGCNAVNHMYNQGIQGVDFIIANTDVQSLEASIIPNKIQLGKNLTHGLGAGSKPEVGRESANEDFEEIQTQLSKNARMLFITAGMGGGTGTGGAPIIAKIAQELGILTVGIVSMPFKFEGRKRRMLAEQGIEELRKYVDTLLVVSNDKLRELYGSLPLSEAFSIADDVLCNAAKGIAELITVTGYINVDFEDVRTVMTNSGVAIMGIGEAEGEDRAIEAVEMALKSPLLNDNNIKGSSHVLMYISSGKTEIHMDEVSQIMDYVQYNAGDSAEIIWGNGRDESLGDRIKVTVVATGFEMEQASEKKMKNEPMGFKEKPIVHVLQTDELNTDPPEEISEEESQEIMFEFEAEPKAEPKVEPLAEPSVTLFDEKEEDSVEETVFDFTIRSASEADEKEVSREPQRIRIEPEAKEQTEPIISTRAEIDTEEADTKKQTARSNSRVEALRKASIDLRTAEGLEEAEKIPAYKRKNIVLAEPKHSSESNVSKYSLEENEEGDSSDLVSNNKFLHDNVD